MKPFRPIYINARVWQQFLTPGFPYTVGMQHGQKLRPLAPHFYGGSIDNPFVRLRNMLRRSAAMKQS